MKQKHNKNPCLLLLHLVLVLLLLMFHFAALPADARRSQSKKTHHHHHHHGHKHHHKHRPDPTTGPNGRTFSVLSFGAKGDGVSDDSKAIVAAWKAACKVPSATVEIPLGFKFYTKPLILKGPCQSDLVLQMEGVLLAPAKVESWPKSSWYQWMNFKWVDNFTIQGGGTVDGQGSNWWNLPDKTKTSKHIPDMKPTAIRFYSSYNVTVKDIKIINSPLCHLKFDSSRGVKVSNVTIISPEESPNTDGIHLQNTRDVEIGHSNIACGDDCVSIQTGCSNVHIHHVSCGPGHGISLGGLGKDKSIACVSNITVDNLTLQSTLYGLRIKTWQGGIGSVKNVSFSNVKVSDVKVPIAIDQYYCDKCLCKNQSRAVAISGIKYNGIVGTYAAQPIYIACSRNVPCTDVDLIDIELKPSPEFAGFRQALCYNSYGKSSPPLLPSVIDYCLRSENRSSEGRISWSPDTVC